MVCDVPRFFLRQGAHAPRDVFIILLTEDWLVADGGLAVVVDGGLVVASGLVLNLLELELLVFHPLCVV